MNTASDCYGLQPLTFWQRVANRFFPQRHEPAPEDLEGFAPSYMVTDVYAVLDWKDRLRVLVSGRLRIETRTKTDVIVGRSESTSVVNVLPPRSQFPRSPTQTGD